jgi:GNAT superfamily N-acetyltransferase
MGPALPHGRRYRRRPIELRLATEHDLAALPAIERSAATAFQGRVPMDVLTSVSPAETWRPHCAAGTLWVACDQGAPIAFLAARRLGPRLHIDEMDVERAWQGKGLGRRLMDLAIAHATEHRLAGLSLTTFRSVPWNAPFYASCGFVEWPPAGAPDEIRAILRAEAARGLRDRCAMHLDL